MQMNTIWIDVHIVYVHTFVCIDVYRHTKEWQTQGQTWVNEQGNMQLLLYRKQGLSVLLKYIMWIISHCMAFPVNRSIQLNTFGCWAALYNTTINAQNTGIFAVGVVFIPLVEILVGRIYCTGCSFNLYKQYCMYRNCLHQLSKNQSPFIESNMSGDIQYFSDINESN